MANAVCFSCLNSVPSFPAPTLASSTKNPGARLRPLDSAAGARLQSIKAKATESNPNTKTTSLVCPDCDGNGAVSCSQCKGAGVNPEDKFKGQFKAGQVCWLCRGKREMLCGGCNGAGFMRGFLSTHDE